MGASASLMEISNQPELTKEIQDEYEKLKAEEKTEEEIETILKAKYEPIINKPKSNPGSPNPARKTVIATASSKEKPPTDVCPSADSWDNVQEQPRCLVCKMTFPSQIKLDRHIKYSDGHKKEVEKAKNAPVEITQEQVHHNLQESVHHPVEGIHFKLLYSGEKFFWRTRDTLDVHIYLHIIAGVVEVIPFDIDKHMELRRSYLEFYLLNNMVVDEARKKVSDQPNQEGVTEEGKLEEASRQLIVSHIMDRLTISTPLCQDFEASSKQALQKQCVYSPLQLPAHLLAAQGEHAEKPILLVEPPSIVIPVHITRRRRTNAEDVTKAMEGIKAAQEELQNATNHAERITELIFMATSGMSSIAAKYAKLRSMGYSKWRLKWIFAARKVIIQNQIAKYTVLIDAWEAKQKQKAVEAAIGGSPHSTVNKRAARLIEKKS